MASIIAKIIRINLLITPFIMVAVPLLSAKHSKAELSIQKKFNSIIPQQREAFQVDVWKNAVPDNPPVLLAGGFNNNAPDPVPSGTEGDNRRMDNKNCRDCDNDFCCCPEVNKQFFLDFLDLLEHPDAVALEGFFAPEVVEQAAGIGLFPPELHVGRDAVIANIIAFSQFATNQSHELVSFVRSDCPRALLKSKKSLASPIFANIVSIVTATLAVPGSPEVRFRQELILRFNEDCLIDRFVPLDSPE